ncbi:hypothetical protein Taro_052320 [Colocasia esculenta]|uniref:RING-type domain-containing protein n=1 Tax=Colocasia esculenta TaxID=4460 RepID=A0A843XJI7_COLES|nr:hypothetical protein [Colocasia esculenta]
MAVEARQQFPSLACNNNNDHDKGGSSAVGWVDNRGELGVDLFRRPVQQQRQVATGTECPSALAMAAYSRHTPPQSGVVLPAEFSCSMASQIDKEKREIDQFLCLQSERLRATLQRQMLSLMRTMEAKASALLRHKEEELAQARRTAAELEERLRRSEADGQAWQRMARESEATAIALSSTLEQVRDGAGGLPSAVNRAEPAASCCSSSSTPPGVGGEPDSRGRPDEAAAGRCRGCGVQDACVLFFPCMHLCACELCDALLAACPVCSCLKQGSMEVFIP